MGFHCDACGKDHEGLPDLGMFAPDPYLDVPESERPDRTFFTEDRCTVRDEDGVEHYFVRGVLYIPIHEQDDPFGLGLWVSQSRANYERFVRREEMEPTFGWIVNRIRHYPEDTFLLKAAVHWTGGNVRPTIEFEPSEHPLAIEQRTGISLARAWQIVHRYMPN